MGIIVTVSVDNGEFVLTGKIIVLIMLKLLTTIEGKI